MIKILFLLALTTFVAAQNITLTTIPIENANFVATVVLQSSGAYVCSATIISRKCVLTTSISRSVGALSVRVGSDSYSKDGQLIKVEKFVNHETYNIGILILYERMKFGPKVGSIELAMQDAFDPDGYALLVYGWTFTSVDPEIYLYGTTNPGLNRAECKKVKTDLDPSQICYGSYNASLFPSCHFFDFMSGGPCVTNNYLYGVSTEFTNVNCKSKVGICMNVGLVRSWIDETVKLNSASSLLINAGLVNVMLLTIYFFNK